MAAIAMKPRVKGAGMPLPAPDPKDEDYAEDMAKGGVEDDPDEDEEDECETSDDDILSILMAEKQQSIGFENGVELEKKRRTALEYSKGEMNDVPSLPNRSKATSTDIAEAIETVMPDLMEIFTGGEDVATFAPIGQEDEEAAQQETDYVLHVAFQKLRGFLLLYTAIKDALQVDTGIIKTWWQDKEEVKEEKLQGITSIQLEMAEKSGAEIVVSTPAEPSMEPDEQGNIVPVPLFNATIRTKYDKGCIESVAVDPNNLTIASDATLDVEKIVYMALRSFPRAQMLVDNGFDEDKVAELDAHTQRNTLDQTELARDNAGESTAVGQDSGNGGPNGVDGKSMMRVVEVHEHFIRADFDKTGKSQLWCVVTDNVCKTLLHKKKVDRIGVSFGTPFIVAHRFYGMGLAEKLIEIQKIKTALLRMMLDSGYFAMNQRTEVAMDQANEHTISDLMRNEPMSPVRSRNGQAVRPLQAGALGFDVGMMLEYTSTMAEQRTGVVRNAQGLNPDSLHDTAQGQKALMTMAQKRVKMIARVLAETLVKGWFLDIHALSRKHATRAEKLRLRGRWVDIDPSEFGDRSDMTIEVGVGSAGKDMELAGLTKILEFQQTMIASGIPSFQEMASPKKVWNASTKFARKVGFKSPEQFFEDPDELEKKKEEAKAQRAQQGIPEPEEPPPPHVVEAKAKMDLEQMKAGLASQQSDKMAAMEAQKFQAEAQMRAQSEERAHQLAVMKLQQDAEIAQAKIMAEMTIAREKMEKEHSVSSYKDQMDAQKVALENEWTRVEMAAAEASRQTAERQHALAARETEMRESNDQAKIAADTRKAELEAMNAERQFQLEQQKLMLEARKVDLQERELSMASATAAAAPKHSEEGEQKADRNQDMALLAQSLTHVLSGMSDMASRHDKLIKRVTAPRMIKRDDGGRVTGVETLIEDDD